MEETRPALAAVLIVMVGLRVASADANATRKGVFPLETTGFVDGNGDQYEAAVTTCPVPCSCLDDYFECRKHGLKAVPKLPDWVRELDLTANKLDDSVDKSIANLSQLITLTLKKNRLRKMPVFTGLIALQRLNLANNKIQAITNEALLTLPNLKFLDLSKNAIRQVLPNSFPAKNNLASLILNYNRLASLEENSLSALKSLGELQMSFNALTSLPGGVFKTLGSLKKLYISNNRLDINWSTFRGLDALKELKLRANNIKQLADGVFHALKTIETIDLDANQIAHLSKQGFYNLTSLRALSLANNSIARIEPDTWEFTQLLESLDLSQNQLSEFRSHHLDCLQRLRSLNLAQNRLQHLSDATFECTRGLEQLNLSRNRLSWVVEDTSAPFKHLKKLLALDLSENNVRTINQKSFLGLASLESLNLDRNNLTAIQFNAFDHLQNLHQLVLRSQNFLCDCNLRWLHEWLTKWTNGDYESDEGLVAVCDYPLNLRRKVLLSLNETDFMCNDSPRPRLIKEPANQLAIKGTNVTLECSAISSESTEMQIQWRRDNVGIDPNETETEMQMTPETNGTLISSFLNLYNVSRDHTGKYQCVVVNSFGTTYSQKFKITVATYPKFLKVPKNITIDSGSEARLDCAAYGEPMPQIFWQKDGGVDFPAARERRMQVQQADNSFYILNAKPVDMGMYTCMAQNPGGTITANASLVVNEFPSFAKPMEDKEATVAHTAVLECLANGSPKPLIRWFKNEQPIEQNERFFFAADGKLLLITDVRPADTGLYRCEIGNALNTITGQSTLTVVQASAGKNVVNIQEMTGIIVITVFCCAVGTSIVWLVIIYQTKKAGHDPANMTAMTTLGGGGGGNNNETTFSYGLNHVDTDSAEYRLMMPASHSGNAAAADHMSSKDSGTGSDTIKRSVEELAAYADPHQRATSCSSNCLNYIELHPETSKFLEHTQSQSQLHADKDKDGAGDEVASNASAPLLTAAGSSLSNSISVPKNHNSTNSSQAATPLRRLGAVHSFQAVAPAAVAAQTIPNTAKAAN